MSLQRMCNWFYSFNRYGDTALMLAAYLGHEQIVDALIGKMLQSDFTNANDISNIQK